MILVPRSFDAQFINAFFFSKDFRRDRLDMINWGRCYDWAYFAVRTFQHLPLQLYSTPGHAFVKLGKRFYDSESPTGSLDWTDLRSNSMWDSGDAVKQSLRQFTKWWDERGGGDRHHWLSRLEPTLRQVLGPDYVPRRVA